MKFYEEEQPTFFQRHRLILAGLVLGALGFAIWLGRTLFEKTSDSRQTSRTITVALPPLPSSPPPPPPTQTPPPPMEQRMITQDPIVDDIDFRPTEAAPADAANDGTAIATGIVGDGPRDGFGLRAHRGNKAAPTLASQRSHGGRWGWYAAQVQRTVGKALQETPATRCAEFRIEARIWADHSGQITRARLSGTTGNSAWDQAITNQVLAGLILPEAPPPGMPMPIVLRLTARPSKVALN